MEQPGTDADEDFLIPLRSGSTFGRWRLTECIGEGGFGEVWLAEGSGGESAAVKLLRSEAGKDRFEREYRLALGQDGLFTARVLDADLDTAQPWIAFEPLSGDTLKAAAPIEEPDLRAFAVDLWLAIASLHLAGIAHRDVSAGNVFISEGRVRLIDFGLARQDVEGEPGPSRLAFGSPGFAAPEQRNGEVVSMEADIWAWGAVCFFASTGRRIRELADELDGVPSWLRAALAFALAEEPAGRSRERIIECIAQSETELFSLRNALAVLELQGQAASSSGVAGPSAAPPTAPAAAAEIAALRAEVRRFVEEQPQSSPPRKRLSVLVPLAVVVAVAVGGLALWAVLRPQAAGPDELAEPESAPITAEALAAGPGDVVAQDDGDAELVNESASSPQVSQPLSALPGAPETTDRGTVLGTDHPGAMSIRLDEAGCTDSTTSYSLELPAGMWEALGTVGLSDATPENANVRIQVGDATASTLTASSRNASFVTSNLSDVIPVTVEVMSSFGSSCGEMPVELLIFDSFIR